MQITPRISEAIKLSSRLHRNQVRKDESQTPYISHLYSVAGIVSSVTDDEDVIIAALMHDSLEDVPQYSYGDLVRDCGEEVANIVLHVTEPLDANKQEDEQLPWLERKEAYLRVLQSGGKESAIISAADKIHNIEEFMIDMEREGDTFVSKFPSSFRNKLWFHDNVLNVVREKLGEDHPLVIRLITGMEKFKQLVPSNL